MGYETKTVQVVCKQSGTPHSVNVEDYTPDLHDLVDGQDLAPTPVDPVVEDEEGTDGDVADEAGEEGDAVADPATPEASTKPKPKARKGKAK